MGTVRTGKMERELRKWYLQWSKDMPSDTSKLADHVNQFIERSNKIINRFGGVAVRQGTRSGFPSPRDIDFTESTKGIADDMYRAAIRAGLSSGQNARTIATAIQGFTTDAAISYHQLERIARTEVVSAYWANQFESAKDLDLVIVWSSEEGPRTCYQCLAREGLVVKDPKTRDHPSGRCTLVPMLPEAIPLRGRGPNPRFNRRHWDGDASPLFEDPSMHDYKRMFGYGLDHAIVHDLSIQQGITAMVSQGWTSSQAAAYLRSSMEKKGIPLPDLNRRQYSILLRLYEQFAQELWEGLEEGTEPVRMYRGGTPTLRTGLYSWTTDLRVAQMYAIRNSINSVYGPHVKSMIIPKEVMRYDLSRSNPQQKEFLLLGEPRVKEVRKDAPEEIGMELGILDAPTQYLPYTPNSL